MITNNLKICILGFAQHLNSFLSEINEEPTQGETRPVNGRLADFPVKTDARTFQSQRQLFAVSVEKTFHCDDGYAFALIARGSDRLCGRAVGHNGSNVYLVAAGITRSAAQASCLWGQQAPSLVCI